MSLTRLILVLALIVVVGGAFFSNSNNWSKTPRLESGCFFREVNE